MVHSYFQAFLTPLRLPIERRRFIWGQLLFAVFKFKNKYALLREFRIAPGGTSTIGDRGLAVDVLRPAGCLRVSICAPTELGRRIDPRETSPSCGGLPRSNDRRAGI